jgi:nitronate monooxygenase
MRAPCIPERDGRTQAQNPRAESRGGTVGAWARPDLLVSCYRRQVRVVASHDGWSVVGVNSEQSALGSRWPVMQASIGRVGDARLALAVSEAGGAGSLGASYMPLEMLSDQVAALNRGTSEPFVVNLILAFDQRERLEVVLAHGAPWVSFSWGLDPVLIERAHAGGSRVLVQVASVAEAVQAAAAGADALIVQGVEAGGHVQSVVPLLELLPAVRGQLSLPLVAAGGICSIRAARAAWAAGADVVSMGTRFAAASESLAHPRYQQRLVEATSDDTVLTELFDIGWAAPHRVVRTAVFDDWVTAGSPPPGQRPGEGELVATGRAGDLPRYAMHPAVIGLDGDVDALPMYAGTDVGAITAVQPAADIVADFANATGPHRR